MDRRPAFARTGAPSRPAGLSALATAGATGALSSMLSTPSTTKLTVRWLEAATMCSSISWRMRVSRAAFEVPRSEEHTSELQLLRHLVCRLLLEKKKKISDLVRA